MSNSTNTQSASLRPLNRDPEYMTGDYASMFNLDVHAGNKKFAENPYKSGSCKPTDRVCFSLTDGALPCAPDQTKIVSYGADGKLHQSSLLH